MFAITPLPLGAARSVGGLPVASPPSACLSVAEAARRLGVSRRLLWKMAKDGTIPSVRLGRRVMLAEKAIEELMAAVDPAPPLEPAQTRFVRLSEVSLDPGTIAAGLKIDEKAVRALLRVEGLPLLRLDGDYYLRPDVLDALGRFMAEHVKPVPRGPRG